ncbi:MAG: endo alpha-1,4 polygalactosaminidase [Myxococcales bacterium]|nr:endo alpha-1,4 polygalactosaminidase [Myxococcales bacterium]
MMMGHRRRAVALVALVALGAAALACSDASSGTNGTTSTTTTATTSTTTSSTTSSSTSTTTGAGGGMPAYATFHLNYTGAKDWSKCAERDFVVFDGLETPAADIAQCRGMGAKLLCYFSSQYEDWRADAGSFGALTGPLDGWPGEQWVDPADPANLAVMIARLDALAQKGCDGVDIDNVDHAGHESYVLAIYAAARARGLLVSQKNAIESIGLFWDAVDLYQNEQCQAYAECGAYANLGRPVYNIEYTPCQTISGLYSNRKDVQAMDAWEEACAP